MQIFVPTHPVEVELAIRPKLEGYFNAEILHPNGTIERPFDRPVKNTILTQYLNTFFSTSLSQNNNCSMIGAVHAGTPTIIVGSSNVATNPLMLANRLVSEGGSLIAPLMSTSTRASSGNSADVDATTGNAIMTINVVFAAALTNMTIREACLTHGATLSGPTWLNLSPPNGWSLNRVVLPNPIVLSAGDVLTMSFTLVVPTLAITPQTVSLPAQNGMNISGQLKLIGNAASILGGTVTVAGVLTADTSSGSAGVNGGGAVFPLNPRGGLTTATAFPTQLTNTTGMNANISSTHVFGPYTQWTLFRDFTTTWNSAFATTNFRSITLYLGNGTYGYQLLLDNQQTKELNRTLSINWRFALS